MTIAAYDIEVFPNYLLISFLDINTQQYKDFEYFTGSRHNIENLWEYLSSIDTLIGFNSLYYDNVILNKFLKTGSVEAVKELNDDIIIRKQYNRNATELDIPSCKSLDVMGILDRKSSLKHYQAFMNLPTILESPISFEMPITQEEIPKVKYYCHYDVWSTYKLFSDPVTQDKLRAKNKLQEVYDLRNISDSESFLSSIILSQEIKKVLGINGRTSLRGYVSPTVEFYGKDIINPDIKFELPELQQALLNAKEFLFSSKTKFELEIKLQDFILKIGQGGMHSIGKTAIITKLSPGEYIIDNDVSSFYPATILLEDIAPEGIKEAFLQVYKKIVDDRLEAKRTGDKARANCEKILINSAFGKFKSKSSFLYNPKSLLQVTLNCQFRLLEVIEKIIKADLEILQINTDGVITFCKSDGDLLKLRDIMKVWEHSTGYQMEETPYKALIMKDANNYVAVKEDGKKKEKGKPFQTKTDLGRLSGGAYPLILSKGIHNYFLKGISPEETVKQAELIDFIKFGKRYKYIEPAGVQTRINRWVYGKEVNNALKSESSTGSGRVKTDDTNIILANNYRHLNVNKIDTERYIQEIKDNIQDLENQSAAKKIVTAWRKKEHKERQDDLFSFVPERPEQKQLSREELLKLYIKLRLPVFGLKPGEKVPYITGWQRKTFEELQREHIPQENNLGLRLDNFITIDIDNPEIAAEKLFDVEIPEGCLICYRGDRKPEDIRKFKTKGHIYFKRPIWFESNANFNSNIGIEIRAGFSQQNAIPPSIHPDGSLYKWHNLELLENLPELTEEIYDKIIEKVNVEVYSDVEFDGTQEEDATQLFKVWKEILDRVLIKKRNFTVKKGTYNQKGVAISNGLIYKGYCPQSEKHSKKAGNANPKEFVLHLSYSGNMKKYCWHTHCKDIWKRRLPDLFKFNLSDRVKGQIERAKKQKEKITAEKIQAIPEETYKELYDRCTIKELKNIIKTLPPKTVLILEGHTGVGKTFNSLESLAEMERNSSIILGTIPQTFKAISILKAKLNEDKDISLVTSQNDDYAESGGGGSQTYRKHIVSTYGYLGRAGDTANTYETAKKILQDRTIVCDEIQLLFKSSIINHDFCKRYKLISAAEANQGTYEVLGKCPRSSGSGNCDNCVPFFKRQAPRSPHYSRRFYHKFDQESGMHFSRKPTLGIISWEDLHDWKNYDIIHGTLLSMPLNVEPDYTLTEDDGKKKTSYIEFLHDVSKKIVRPEIRIELPVWNEKPLGPEQIPDLHQEEMDNVKYPVYGCAIPKLLGIDSTPYLQLLEYAHNLIITSATIPKDFINVLKILAKEKEWDIKYYSIEDIPNKFDITVLKTTKAISIDRQQKILTKLNDIAEERTLTIASKLVDAKALYNKLAQNIPEQTKLFCHKDYITKDETHSPITLSRGIKGDDKHLITYAFSGITSSIDMPDRSILIVDCQQFLPQATLLELRGGMTQEEKNRVLCSYISDNLLQIIGRLLRSSSRIPGQTTIDERKLVVLLHGLPDELLKFKLPEEIFYKYREFANNFVDPNQAKVTSSLVEAIVKCGKGEEPENKVEEYKEEIKEKVVKKDLSALSKKQRKILTEEEKKQLKFQRDLEKFNRKVEMGKDMLEVGQNKRDIYRKLNIQNLTKKQQELFWREIYKNDSK